MPFTNSNAQDFRRLELRMKMPKVFPDEVVDTVTQITTRATDVTLNSTAGQITTDDTSLAAAAEATFTVNNSFVTAKTIPVIAAASGQTAGTSTPIVSAVAAGSFDITLQNHHASTADTGPMVINFALIDVD